MATEAKALLDSLMGRNRDAPIPPDNITNKSNINHSNPNNNNTKFTDNRYVNNNNPSQYNNNNNNNNYRRRRNNNTNNYHNNHKNKHSKQQRYDKQKEPDLSSLIIDDDNHNKNEELSTNDNNTTTATTTATEEKTKIKIAFEGCCHGDLNIIYKLLQQHEKETETNIDLLIICGDFQSMRNRNDLSSMAVPDKYKTMKDFHEYYSGAKVAPILTLFIGGNHENSNQMQELHYGGWVAQNIYYLGHANVITFGGLRIGGISGIYKQHDYLKPRFEAPPYNPKSVRSIYHIRQDAIHRLSSYKNTSNTNKIDIFISHDWPRGIEQYGNIPKLLRIKPYFRKEVEDNTLGNPKTEELLHSLKPRYWFSAHLHVAFEAKFDHKEEKGEEQRKEENCTYFRALDKCLPKRKFIRIMSFPNKENKPLTLEYDLEWLAIIKKTHFHTPSHSPPVSISVEETKQIQTCFQDGDYTIPSNFQATVPYYNEEGTTRYYKRNGDPQTDVYLKRIGLNHTNVTIPYLPLQELQQFKVPSQGQDQDYDENVIDLDDAEVQDANNNQNCFDYDENAIDMDDVKVESIDENKIDLTVARNCPCVDDHDENIIDLDGME